MHAVVVELKLWKQLSIREYFIIVALSSAEAPAGHPNKNSNNQKIESGRGKMVFSFSMSPAISRSLYRGESHCRKTQIQYYYRLSNHQTLLLKGSIGSCQKSVTVEPRYNKPLNDEVLGITNDFLYPSDSEILLLCTWCHGGHVGCQEQKLSSSLGTRLYFHVNSSRKILYCIDPQHGCLVTWLQTKNMKKKLDLTKPCHSEHILPVPWPFVWLKFQCIMLIRRLKRVVRIEMFHFLSPNLKMIGIWNLKFLSVFFEKLNLKGLFIVGTFKNFSEESKFCQILWEMYKNPLHCSSKTHHP